MFASPFMRLALRVFLTKAVVALASSAAPAVRGAAANGVEIKADNAVNAITVPTDFTTFLPAGGRTDRKLLDRQAMSAGFRPRSTRRAGPWARKVFETG